MADAKITITADAQEAKASLEELRQIASSVFEGTQASAEKAAQGTEQLAQAWSEAGATVGQARQAAAELRPEVDGLAAAHRNASTASTEQSFNLKELTKSVLGGVSVIAILKANLDDLRTALEPAGNELRRAAEAMGMDSDSAKILTNTLESLVNPFTIVENLTANLKISAEALARALYDEASAADAASEAQQRKAGIMASVLSEQQKLVAEEQKGTESLERRTEALWRQIEVEQQSGEVKKFYLDKLKGILDEYDRRGDTPPEKVAKLAAELGVLSGEQEKVAAGAGREAEAQSKVVEQQDKLIPQLQAIAEGKREQAAATDEAVRALREEIDALEENAKAAQKVADQAQGKASDAAKRIAELEGSPVLTLEETEELADLKREQVGIDQEAADAAENAAQAAFEYGDAQDALAQSTTDATGALDDQAKSGDVVADLWAKVDAATAAYTATLADVGDQAQSTTAYVEAIGKNGQKFWTNFTDTIVDSGRALDGTADAAGQIPDELSKIGPAAERAGEGLAGLDEALAGDGEGGFAKTAQDIDSVNTGLERTHELARLIRLEFQRINTAIGGASE